MFEEYVKDFISTCKDGSRLVAAKEKWIMKIKNKYSDLDYDQWGEKQLELSYTVTVYMDIFCRLLHYPESEILRKLFVYAYDHCYEEFYESLPFLFEGSKKLKQALYTIRLLSNSEKLNINLKFPEGKEWDDIKEMALTAVQKSMELYISIHFNKD